MIKDSFLHRKVYVNYVTFNDFHDNECLLKKRDNFNEIHAKYEMLIRLILKLPK